MAIKNIHKSRRSGNIPCEICGRLGIPLQRHHLRGRDIDNWNKGFNCAYLCGCCHTLVHDESDNGIVVEGWFSTTNGKKLIWRKRSDPSITGEECKCHLVD